MIAREMIAEKVFAESVAKDIRNFLPEKYENAEFQVMQMNKNNGVQMIGVQVRLQEENVCPVVYVGSFFNEIRLGENVDFGLRSHDMLYALTNVEKQYGASMITQPEVLNKLEQLFPEGFYVLPSSVHEVLIVPDNGEMEPKMLGEMVREVNKNEVERQEVLSDRVYSYDKEKHQIRQEPDSIQQVKEMER